MTTLNQLSRFFNVPTQKYNATLFQTLHPTASTHIISTIDDDTISNITAAINIHGLDSMLVLYLNGSLTAWLAATIQVVPLFALR